MPWGVHGAVAHLDTLGDAARDLAHVGEGLQRLVVWSNAADLEEELLNPCLQKSHDLGCNFPDLIILQREWLG